MIVEVTTLGAGTYDVVCDDKDLESLCKRIMGNHSFPMLLIFKQAPSRGGVPIILNLSNIVSIKAKR